MTNVHNAPGGRLTAPVDNAYGVHVQKQNPAANNSDEHFVELSQFGYTLELAGGPAAAPVAPGLWLRNTTNQKLYYSVGTSGIADWGYVPVNDKMTIGADFDGGGNVLVNGVHTTRLVPVSGTIERIRLFGDVANGTVTVTVAAASFAALPTFSQIGEVTMTSAQKLEDTTLSGWTPVVAALTHVRITLSNISNINKLSVDMIASKT